MYNIFSHRTRNCAIGLLFLVSLEFCARMDDVLIWKAPFWSRYSNELLTMRDALGGHRGHPNARFEKWQMNSFGFRGPEFEEKKPAGVIRIMAVGASETFGLYEKAGGEYPEVVGVVRTVSCGL